jgi:gliding motility-associated lipoprotein GldD
MTINPIKYHFNFLNWMPLILVFFVIIGCGEEETQPKPKAYLALTYDEASYINVDLDCPFSFEMNVHSRLQKPRSNRFCWTNLYYPKQKATVFITYVPVEGNLNELLRDAQQLPLQHTIKADHIEASIYTNKANRTFGTFYEVEGDAASQAQFYLTDSIQHFLTGSIYFSARPNYDSLVPAAAYLKKDIRHLMESVTWK